MTILCEKCNRQMWIVQTGIKYVVIPICPICDTVKVLRLVGMTRTKHGVEFNQGTE